ncbi:hypothetical protein ETB97_000546 [Aspergillus alliaceus]|uniref:Uncharacterized protein n=1 Tax=Petromyces alliaceus TaxID=209559 RepID=A0A8H6A3Z9_PETAA|nr:hypothetical protein ETB97_000546 [Aspergillus burnettii]
MSKNRTPTAAMTFSVPPLETQEGISLYGSTPSLHGSSDFSKSTYRSDPPGSKSRNHLPSVLSSSRKVTFDPQSATTWTTPWHNKQTPTISKKPSQSPTKATNSGSWANSSSYMPLPWYGTQTISSPLSGFTPTSSPTAGSTWTVTVTPDKVTEFHPPSMNASVGDSILFSSTNGSFFLYNTTLEAICKPSTIFGDGAHTNILYTVNSTEPMWFLGYKYENWFNCFPPSHFALNPGNQQAQYSSIIHTNYVYISFTEAQYHRPTTTITTVVTVHPT